MLYKKFLNGIIDILIITGCVHIDKSKKNINNFNPIANSDNRSGKGSKNFISNSSNADFLRKEQHKNKEMKKLNIKKALKTAAIIAASSLMLYFSMPHNYNNKTKSFKLFNWSGYIAASSFTNPMPIISGVSGEWRISKINNSDSKGVVLDWIGIGGIHIKKFNNDKTLIQTGTESYYSEKHQKFITAAWYELLPHSLKQIKNFNIKTKDKIVAEIKLINKPAEEWEIELKDINQNELFKKFVHYKSSMLSAEWVAERPEIIGFIYPYLAHFNKIKFIYDSAKINSITSPLGMLHYKKIDMINSKGQVLAHPSKLKNNSSFDIVRNR